MTSSANRPCADLYRRSRWYQPTRPRLGKVLQQVRTMLEPPLKDPTQSGSWWVFCLNLEKLGLMIRHTTISPARLVFRSSPTLSVSNWLQGWNSTDHQCFTDSQDPSLTPRCPSRFVLSDVSSLSVSSVSHITPVFLVTACVGDLCTDD
jgi:hypothetical protein